MTYSIVLPTLNRAKLVKNSLACFEEQTILPYEVIIVDQSDDHDTRDIFSVWDPPGIKKKYIHREVKSLILARHAGLDATDETDLVAFFDDDITLDPSFCEEIVKVFASDQAHRYAGGMGTVAGWKYRPKPFQTFFLMPHEGSGRFLASGAQTFPHWKKEFSETEFLSGGCTFWRRRIIARYRFDERLSGYGHADDVDVSYRVSRDHKLFFQPKSVCYQIKDPAGKDPGRTYRRVWIQNMYYLAQKNKLSMAAYAWCTVGHMLRDLICLDFQKFLGCTEGIWNIIRDRVDTVQGYGDFKHKIETL